MLALALTLLAAVQPTETSSASPRIELITIGPGDSVFSYWGHSALRVVDPRDGTDQAYNFGGIKVDDDLMLRMTQGHVEAFVYASSFSDLLRQYSAEDRTITRRPLRLAPSVASAIAERLRVAPKGEDSRYRYHHFRDNCATRIVQVLDDALEGAISERTTAETLGTFRSHVLRPARRSAWLYLALDLMSTAPVDRPMTRFETAFLSEDLGRLLDGLTFDGQPFTTGEFEIFRSISQENDVLWVWPWFKIQLLFVAPLIILGLFFARPLILAIGLASGSVGVALTLVTMFTTYDFASRNWNLLVFPPTHLALALLALRRAWLAHLDRWVRGYVIAHAAILLLLLAAGAAGIIGQAIGPGLGFSLPLTLTLARSCLRAPLETA